jgi:hypothetical protein
MSETPNLGICRCADSPGGSLLAEFHFWWAEIKIYYCSKCDGLSLEVISENNERVPDRSLVDVFSDLPSGRSVILMDASWIESLANIVRGYLKDQHYRSEG